MTIANEAQSADQDAINGALEDVITFVSRDEFRKTISELYRMPVGARYKFVEDILLDDCELRKRGIAPPEGLTIQRSVFADGRPTLFCVSKRLPQEGVWKKVTITFDNEMAL